MSADYRTELEDAGECAFVSVEQGEVNLISVMPKPRIVEEDEAPPEISING
jgi:hypothetical protein